jgi:hypothetical protein
MPLTYYAGTQQPTASDISTLLALTAGNLTPNDLEILLDAVNAKPMSRVAPGSQTTLTNLLP